MRLYLSSYQLGDHPEAFTGMVRGKKRGWVIMNAFDGADPQMRRSETERQLVNLAGLGLTAHEFDLRTHDPESLTTEFGEPDFVWVRGGNVFTLRAALARSGADALIVDRLRADSMVYAGFSAGGCVLAPSLLGLEECDSTDDALLLYGAVEFDGLNILDRPFVPHLGTSDHPERESLTQVAAAYAQDGKQYWALRDGQALVVDGSSVALF
ncbi:Type 1 glutamine amidotransferase-like domain-containing protein [Paeniglutamicibacter sp. NPDC012692]|uniref:Type 1 glutamine amidotransferase-like domain-containing protein n=1 Tax=Paeniglutamicibacter sp. NPDC012692 TaxID=3364388 RepID=UPI00369515D7